MKNHKRLGLKLKPLNDGTQPPFGDFDSPAFDSQYDPFEDWLALQQLSDHPGKPEWIAAPRKQTLKFYKLK